MKYGYTRISTLAQENNTSLQKQKDEILEKYPDAVIISEVFSGVENRKKFNELLDNLQENDLIICTKIDRFCRSAKEGLQYIDIILDKGASLHILNTGLIDRSPMGRMISTIFLGFSEFERALIIERTQAGRARARLKPGYKDGRKPKYSKEQIDHALALLEHHSYRQTERMTGISVSTLVRAKRKLNTEKNNG